MRCTVDAFGPAGESVTFGAFGSAAPTKSLLAAWVAFGIAENFRIHGDTCPQTPDSVEPVTIGGQPGTLVALNCGILINTAFTVANGYGYRFGFRDPAIQAALRPMGSTRPSSPLPLRIIPGRLSMPASLTFGTIRPRSVAAAMPRFT